MIMGIYVGITENIMVSKISKEQGLGWAYKTNFSTSTGTLE